MRKVKQLKGVSNYIFLDVVVEGRISAETWRAVNLQKLWLEFLVNQDVHSQNLKCHRVIQAFWLRNLVLMPQLGRASNDSLHDHVFHFSHEFVRVAPFLLQDAQDSAEGPLMAPIIVIIAMHILVGVLVQRIVGQVHERVVEVVSVRAFVLLRAKPGERHLVQVDPQRIHAIQEHVEAEVVFKFIDQVWPIDILLDNVAYFFRVDSMLHQ